MTKHNGSIVRFHLENCYGIGNFQHDFEFESSDSTFAIYAPNGTMKTSLTDTLLDIHSGSETTDAFLVGMPCTREITDGNGLPIDPARILAVPPYQSDRNASDAAERLLASPELRRRHAATIAAAAADERRLLDALAGHMKLKADLIATTLRATFDNISIGQVIEDEISRVRAADTTLHNVPYKVVSDHRVERLLEDTDLRRTLGLYLTRHREVLDTTDHFSDDTFTPSRARVLLGSLESSRFFDAGHSLNLAGESRANAPRSIASPIDLDALIVETENEIKKDPTLHKHYDRIAKAIGASKEVREFHELILARPDLIEHLLDYQGFLRDVLRSVLRQHIDEVDALVASRRAAQRSLATIAREATKHESRWETAIELFARRFTMPFDLRIANKEDVVLGTSAPQIEFEVKHDAGHVRPISKATLERRLSQGERRALYLLHIILEIEARRHEGGEPTLVVFDDIADSFDYVNKHAIVEYLRDIAKDPQFNVIVLTHNFDLFRSVVKFSTTKLFAVRHPDRRIELSRKGGNIEKPFENMRDEFFTKPDKRVAAIPFARNLVEYAQGTRAPAYELLTCLLHWKPARTPTITVGELATVFCELTNQDPRSHDLCTSTEHAVTELLRVADRHYDRRASPRGPLLEHKLILAIGSRLLAEKYMIDSLPDRAADIHDIERNQMRALIDMYSTSPNVDEAALRTIERINLITPESIHLNAFMFEPIIDLSPTVLHETYAAAKTLAARSSNARNEAA